MASTRNFLTLSDISQSEFEEIMSLARRMKLGLQQGVRPQLLSGRNLSLIFEKPSLRTRLSFEAGMTQLGGGTMASGGETGWKSREPVGDYVRVLCEYVDAIVCRTFSHTTIEEVVSYSSKPVINGLSDFTHPCQALADIQTVMESRGDCSGAVMTFVGDGNNVSRSLAHVCALSGLEFRLLGPSGYLFDEGWLSELQNKFPDSKLSQTSDIGEGIKGTDFIYTDVWTSMGQEAESAKRRSDFADYQVNANLLSRANKDCGILHCLPAKRGEEITDEVIESKNSLVFQEAGNRMHAQKGLLVWLGLQHSWVDPSDLDCLPN